MTALPQLKSSGISVVLGSYNRRAFLRKVITGIRNDLSSSGIAFEIIVIDGGSMDGTVGWLVRQKDIITIVQHNRGRWRGKEIERRPWGYFMNLAFRAASGKYVCMLSDDSFVVPGAIVNGYRLFQEKLSEGKNVGAVAFYWRDWPIDKKYRIGTTLGNKLFVNHGMYLNEALQQVGYIDEETYSFYHADGDLCLKLWQAGYSCIESPTSYIEHYSYAAPKVRKTNVASQRHDWQAYLDKWTAIYYDPGSPNVGGWLEKEYKDEYCTARVVHGLHFRNLVRRITYNLFSVSRYPEFAVRLMRMLRAKRK